MKYLILFFLSTSAYADKMFAHGLNCQYERIDQGIDYKENFSISKSAPEAEIVQREFSVKVVIAQESFKTEFKESDSIKVVNQTVKNVWTLKRKPSELKAQTKLGQVKLKVVCR